MPSDNPKDFVLYDGECPVCRRYVAWTRLRQMRPDIALLDARGAPDLVAELRAKEIEINDTMVIVLDGVTLQGAAAMSLISRLAAPGNPLTAALMWVMRKESVAGPLYPVLVAARKLLLRLMGRPLI